MLNKLTLNLASAPARPTLLLLACALVLLFTGPMSSISAQTTTAVRRNGERTGRLEISTVPGGYPVIIDGQPQGETSATVRYIELGPGPHRVEILFPSDSRWVRTFIIEGGRKYCIALSYRPKTISLPRVAQSPCPYPVNISTPSSVTEGSLVTFSAEVGYPGAAAGLNYTWSVSPETARITNGAGTPTITVDTTGVGRQRVTATLVVDDGSGDPTCRQRAQAASLVTVTPPPPVQPRRFDEFPSIAFDDDKARLDNFAVELQNNPTATGYVIIYGGSRSPLNRADKLGARALDYLTSKRGIDTSRIVVVNAGYRARDTFELWLVPQGATPPQTTPTVLPDDVRPSVDRAPRRPRRNR